jgi:hypothetical protein
LWKASCWKYLPHCPSVIENYCANLGKLTDVEDFIVSNRTEELYVEFDEKHTVKEASKTRQNAEYKLIVTTSVDIIKPYAGNTATADHETNHKKFEKIDVPVCLERAVTEEIAVVRLNADQATLTASKGIKNKFDEVYIDWDSTEEFDVEQQNAVNTTLTDFNYLRDDHTVL